MSDDPYKAPTVDSQPIQSREMSEFSIVSSSLWVAIGTVGFVPLISAFFYGQTPLGSVLLFVIGCALVALCHFGLRFCWGPVLPCVMISGAMMPATLSPTADFSHLLIATIAGMIGGGFVGYLLAWWR